MESNSRLHNGPRPEAQETDFEILGRVAGGIAHDLNNHLSPILLGVQTLQRHDPDEKTKRILSMVELAARKASDLVRHILDYSRAARSTNVLLSRNDIAAMLLDQSSQLMETKARIIMEDDRQWSLAMDADVFGLIVKPLFLNAVESGSPLDGIEVRLGYEASNDHTETSSLISPRDRMFLSIRDGGSGMTEEILAQASHPFFTTRAEEGHAGLGLFLAHTLVKQSNGTLHVDSHVGKGTTVRIHIPVAATGRG